MCNTRSIIPAGTKYHHTHRYKQRLHNTIGFGDHKSHHRKNSDADRRHTKNSSDPTKPIISQLLKSADRDRDRSDFSVKYKLIN